MIESEHADADYKLKSVLENLIAGCNRYVTIVKGASSGSGIGKTKLDKERMKLCHYEMVMLLIILLKYSCENFITENCRN